jgi:hypothetical protein
MPNTNAPYNMEKKLALVVIAFAFLLNAACGTRSADQKDATNPVESEGNQLLEKEAWRIHDEVMPKMGALHKWKTRLNEKLNNTPTLSAEEKLQLEQTVTELDGAYRGMMDWMHNFKPEKHDESEEAAREYLENEIEAIKQVKQDILDALEKAEAISLQDGR